ncbi:SDR family oxidoreductase [Peribacillus sp. V2I11]|uniref:SDR family oxidoreductase n=1 Tax=Peribacillus sp. V2I11 TaxID=3042277 RepID=UPI00277E5ED7|nr:SDR family oxidoreductase [Peribacillus sp. V2I11]MDQ0879068.1 NADP-dependent 3-hydroxy acid dehydrogenase YdfG [Peribacillus sp. V2I11]
MSNIQNKVVVITGASSGIGESTAKELASKGAKLVLAARREDRLKKLHDEIQTSGGQAIYKVTDVTSREQMEELAAFALKEFGKIDVLVNNAGIMPQAFLAETKVDEWDKMIDVNIKGVLYAIASIVPSMRERKSGHVINLSSVAGHNIYPGGTVYCGTKYAVRTISEGLRQEEAMSGTNIRVTNISPGAISSELLKTTTDPTMKEGLDEFYKIAIDADRIAHAITFAIEQPSDVGINEMIIRPTVQVG